MGSHGNRELASSCETLMKTGVFHGGVECRGGGCNSEIRLRKEWRVKKGRDVSIGNLEKFGCDRRQRNAK